MGLILAQGAEHTTPDNLARIVGIINEQRWMERDIISREQMIADGIGIAERVSYFIGNNENYIDGYRKGIYTINLADYSVEEKYDGFSYLNDNARFFSKRLSDATGSKGQPIEKTGHLPHIRKVLDVANYLANGLDLHGEICIPGGISDDVTKIMGCTEDKAVQRINQLPENKKPRYRLIDIRQINGKIITNEPHRIRRAVLEFVYKNYIEPNDPNGYVMMTEELHGDPRDEFKRIVLAGGEGIIIKREDAIYVPDKKPANNWIKGKKKVTHDVVIMGLNDGTGKNKDIFGSIEFGHMVDGKLVKCGNCSSGLSDDIRMHIYRNIDSMMNKQVFEIEAIQESVKSFRNAVFLRLRDDKDWSECNPVNIRIKTELL